jgi:hypothetical protein
MAIIYGIADSEKNLLSKLPDEVKNMDDMRRVKREFEEKLENVGNGFFSGMRKWNYKRQINKFGKKDVRLYQMGAKGENKVIDELSRLDDCFHILSGVEVYLTHFVTYNGKKNLKSAQIDIVVVCPKGVFMIEVKNWSDKYAQSDKQGLNPYEQTERDGRVLWILLQSVNKDIRVTNILLSIKGNLTYNQNYRSVFVSSLDGINKFLEKRQDTLNEKESQDC